MNQSSLSNQFRFSGIVEPPVLANRLPILKEEDPDYKRPQEVPFFNSEQFKLWEPEALDRYNQLINILSKWNQLGWGQYFVSEKFLEEHQNWVVWVQWINLAIVPVEEIQPLLKPAAVTPEFGA